MCLPFQEPCQHCYRVSILRKPLKIIGICSLAKYQERKVYISFKVSEKVWDLRMKSMFNISENWFPVFLLQEKIFWRRKKLFILVHCTVDWCVAKMVLLGGILYGFILGELPHNFCYTLIHGGRRLLFLLINAQPLKRPPLFLFCFAGCYYHLMTQ